jgi:hypothetical protein
LPYGGKALGRVTFTADGRMMSVVCDGRKELPAGVSREYSSYCGNYTYDGERLVTRVDAASTLLHPAWALSLPGTFPAPGDCALSRA